MFTYLPILCCLFVINLQNLFSYSDENPVFDYLLLIFYWFFFFSLYWVVKVVCMFWMQLLSQTFILQNFIPVSVWSFHFLNCAFHRAHTSNFGEIQFIKFLSSLFSFLFFSFCFFSFLLSLFSFLPSILVLWLLFFVSCLRNICLT